MLEKQADTNVMIMLQRLFHHLSRIPECNPRVREVANLTLRGHEKIDVLQDVKEELIPSVFDAFSPPPNLTSDLKVASWQRKVELASKIPSCPVPAT